MSNSMLPQEIVALAQDVVAKNLAAGRRIALAESCTGGLVAAAITEIPGSSAVFDRGFVTYSDAAKEADLGVSGDIIEAFGAVSVACVYAMAMGALERTGADVAVAISGIAGPGGGSEFKPVGTVVFARMVRGEHTPRTMQRLFAQADGEEPGRAFVRHQATICALELLLP